MSFGTPQSWASETFCSLGVTPHCFYLEEGEGGGARQAAVLNHILIGQVIEAFHRQLSGLRGLSGAEVGEITSQEDNGKNPPRAADDAS